MDPDGFASFLLPSHRYLSAQPLQWLAQSHRFGLGTSSARHPHPPSASETNTWRLTNQAHHLKHPKAHGASLHSANTKYLAWGHHVPHHPSNPHRP